MVDERYRDLAPRIARDEGVREQTAYVVLEWLDRNEDQTPLLKTGDSDRLMNRLKDSFLAADGCGSDMQETNPEWNAQDGTIRFHGEGSIDVYHAVEEVIAGIENLRAGKINA